MDIFNQKHVLFDIDVKNQMNAFKKIAKLAKQLKVIDDEQNLIDGFVRREKVSTTGMKDSFAIPHAMSANIKKPAIIAARFKKGVD
jgi:mannitol/fructose-specific phosphotransferase system IIA component (Ntr-type)